MDEQSAQGAGPRPRRVARWWARARVLGAWAVVAPLLVGAAPVWQLLSSDPILIRARNRPGTPVRELWAEGDVEAPLREVQEAILDCAGFPRFMPYVKECRLVGPRESDGSQLSYTRMAPPLIEARDYVIRMTVDHEADSDGSGEFSNRWTSVPDALPASPGAVRIRVNEGSWHATSLSGGKTHLVYRLSADPGGALPLAIANLSNRSAVVETFGAIEREAKRRVQEHAHGGGK